MILSDSVTDLVSILGLGLGDQTELIYVQKEDDLTSKLEDKDLENRIGYVQDLSDIDWKQKMDLNEWDCPP